MKNVPLCGCTTMVESVSIVGGSHGKKEKKGYSPSAGYEVSREDCKESIKRRITLIREELLNISKEL